MLQKMNRRGMTILELLVSFAILTVMFLMVAAMVNAALKAWSLTERVGGASYRALHASRVMESDLRAATAPPAGDSGVLKSIFQVRSEADGNSRLVFTRAIGAGRERAFTGTAGDGRPERTQDSQGGFPAKSKGMKGAVLEEYDNEKFDTFDNDGDGLVDEDLEPLGGLMLVAYFVENGVLYRRQLSPVPVPLPDVNTFCNTAESQILASGIEFFGVDCWTPVTEPGNWEGRLPRNLSGDSLESSAYGSEIQWDSTRGILSRRDFALAKSSDSLTDSSDDVFPERVRITITVDLEAGRSIFAPLDADVGSSDLYIPAGDMTGFPPGGREDSYAKIDGEWVYYSERSDSGLILDSDYGRGVRGTEAVEHKAGAKIIAGVQRTTVVDLPQFSGFFRGSARESLGDSRGW